MRNLLLVGLLAIALSSCGGFMQKTEVPDPVFKIGKPYTIRNITYVPKVETEYSEVGMASWYGQRFHGRKTANGDVFNKNQMTAAHKTLPLPSVVKVTNLENGKTANLLVNDRGPFARGRVLDVSESAAVALGFRNQGHAKVKVEFLLEESYAAAKGVKLKEADRHMLDQMYGFSGNQQHMPLVPVEKVTMQEVVTETTIRPLGVLEMPARPQIISHNANIYQSPQNNLVANKPAEYKPVEKYAEKYVGNDYYVQVAAVSSVKDAVVAKSAIHNYDTIVEEVLVNGKSLYRLQVGGFASQLDAENAKNNLIKLGYKGAYVVKK